MMGSGKMMGLVELRLRSGPGRASALRWRLTEWLTGLGFELALDLELSLELALDLDEREMGVEDLLGPPKGGNMGVLAVLAVADLAVERVVSLPALGDEGPVMRRRPLRVAFSACSVRLARESESVLQESISTSSLGAFWR